MAHYESVPFLDLITPHLRLEDELVSIVRTTFRTAQFIGGPVLEMFEQEFAGFCNTKYCLGVASGTDAMRFALMAAGVQSGDIVVTVPNTFIATTEAISQVGATPHFVDIDKSTFNIDPRKLQTYIEEDCCIDILSGRLTHLASSRPVTAVVPVHLYGQTADMDPILALAGRFGLKVIEDACQAHGAEYYSETQKRWCKAGSMGIAAAFSFYPGKNLGACGEAGAVTTNSEMVAKKVRMLRDHGQSRKYYHDIEGYNGRLDAIQAGILAAKLKHLQHWNDLRDQAAKNYGQLLEPGTPDIILPYQPSWAKAVYHLYVVRVPNREQLQAYLGEANIGTAIHYPIPLHLQPAYGRLGNRAGDFPVVERVAHEILSLPIYPQLQMEQQRRVAEQVLRFLSGAARSTQLAVLAR